MMDLGGKKEDVGSRGKGSVLEHGMNRINILLCSRMIGIDNLCCQSNRAKFV